MNGIAKRRKSVALTKEELKAYKEYLNSFRTHTEAALDLDLNSVNMVGRVLLVGSASPETVAKIRQKISV